jgi:monoamine oxidase
VLTEIFMSDPSEVSLLHGLQMIHALKGLDWVTGAEGGAQQDVVVGGMQAVAERLAHGLGDSVHLGVPVRLVRQGPEGAEVVSDALTVRATRVICAIPPILAGRMDFDPPLPPLKSQLLDRSPAGQCIRCYTVYPEPFWRADGLTGQGADLDAVPQASIDLTPPSGRPGVLTAYIWGPPARHHAAAPDAERRQVFLGGLVKRFGPKAAAPTHYQEVDWAAQRWTRGDMCAHYAPGVLTGFGRALREPCGRIHWAGTETATLWGGSIEGAIRSGERAADEVTNDR